MLTVDRKKFLDELAYVLGAQGRNLSLSIGGSELSLVAQGHINCFTSRVHADNPTGQAWRHTVDGNILAGYVKLIRDKSLSFCVNDVALVVTHDVGEARLPLSLVNVQRPATLSTVASIELERTVAQSLVNATAFAAVKHWHAYVSGTLLEVADQTATMVATDGTLMAIASSPATGPNGRIVIAEGAMRGLQRLIQNESADTVTLTETENSLMGVCGDRAFVASKAAGAFPNYTRFIPKDLTNRLDCNREIFLEALRLTSLGDEIGAAIIEMKEDELSIECGTSKNKIAANCQRGMTFQVSTRYLTQILTNCPGERVEILSNDPKKPIMLTPLSQTSVKYVLIPIVK